MTPSELSDSDPHTSDRLLARGNTLAAVVASALELLSDWFDPSIDKRRQFTPEELRSLATDLRTWSADVRAVASEEMP